MKTLKTYNEDQLTALTLKELAHVYNIVALELDVKQVKKFSTKIKGEERVAKIQKEYLTKLAEQKAKAKPAKKSDKAGRMVEARIESDKFKENSIRYFIVEVVQIPVTYETLVGLIVEGYTKPRSHLAVDEAFAKQAINWMLNQGFIELQ